jgi:hypothetical protein
MKRRTGLFRPARSLAATALLAIGLAIAPMTAEARGFVRFGFGFPIFVGPPPVVYAPPPVFYGPPPVIYGPPPAGYYAPPAGYYAPPSSGYPPPPAAYPSTGQDCRPYKGTAVIDGQTRTLSGTACRQPDGSWRATN